MMKQSLLWDEMFKNQSSVSPNDQPKDLIKHVSYWIGKFSRFSYSHI